MAGRNVSLYARPVDPGCDHSCMDDPGMGVVHRAPGAGRGGHPSGCDLSCMVRTQHSTCYHLARPESPSETSQPWKGTHPTPPRKRANGANGVEYGLKPVEHGRNMVAVKKATSNAPMWACEYAHVASFLYIVGATLRPFFFMCPGCVCGPGFIQPCTHYVQKLFFGGVYRPCMFGPT